MITPNLFTIVDEGSVYGLHKFRDGQIMLVKQHSSGDWQTLRPARERELRHFEKYGQKA